MFGRKKKGPITGRIDTLIARSALIKGDVEFSGGLHLEGKVSGNLRAAAATSAAEPSTLWISEPGSVEGTVDVASVVINGSVIGDVFARDRIVIGAKARINGNVHYGTIEMALGAEVNGKLIPMGTSATASATAAAGSSVVAAGARESAVGAVGPANVTSIPVGSGFDARKSGT